MRPNDDSALLLADTARAARRAELRYVSWEEPGIRRIRRGKSFRYVSPNGSRVKNPSVLARIRSLAIPPAWKDVWICPRANGHLQAIGRDARGRRQYRYHARWREVRDEAKYHDVVAFARCLPRLRRRIARDLGGAALSKDKVLATVVRVMERTCVRVGNERYAESNHSYGLTTLLDRHAHIGHGMVEFRFRGKGGKPYRKRVRDARLASIVGRCRDVPGQRLFQYEDDGGEYRAITSTDVNDYLHRAMGHPFTAKTFRTWAGTLATASLLANAETPTSARARERTLKSAVARVAERLGNTAAVCRKSYVHPDIVNAWTAGALGRIHRGRRRAQDRSRGSRAPSGELRSEERTLLRWLEKRSGRRRKAPVRRSAVR